MALRGISDTQVLFLALPYLHLRLVITRILLTSFNFGCSGKDHDRTQDPSNIDLHGTTLLKVEPVPKTVQPTHRDAKFTQNLGDT